MTYSELDISLIKCVYELIMIFGDISVVKTLKVWGRTVMVVFKG